MEYKKYREIRTLFNAKLAKNNLGNGYITLWKDGRIFIECALTVAQLETIVKIREDFKEHFNE